MWEFWIYINLKIRHLGRKKLVPLFSLFLMREPLSSGQKWFLRPELRLRKRSFLLKPKPKTTMAVGKWFSHEEKWEKGLMLMQMLMMVLMIQHMMRMVALFYYFCLLSETDSKSAGKLGNIHFRLFSYIESKNLIWFVFVL